MHQTTVKTIEVSNSPVRNAKFIARKQWVVTGSDDLQIRIFNYNTMERIGAFEAHRDFIRWILVHPTSPFIISASDDCTIKIWNWETKFELVKNFNEHIHYVMMLAFNPTDPNTFASASLDKTIKVPAFKISSILIHIQVWNINNTSGKPNYTLTGHTSGVNCLDYYKGDKPYLVSGGDDK